MACCDNAVETGSTHFERDNSYSGHAGTVLTSGRLLNVLAVCVGAAFCLLSLYCGIKARQNTTPAGSPPTGYNSSASAVLAVWLFFQTYMANVLRSALPQFQFPVIIYSIFLVVSLTYGTYCIVLVHSPGSTLLTFIHLRNTIPHYELCN